MTSKITFEIGTLADVIRRAGSVAPSKAGNSFDRAAGLVLDVTPGDDVKCVIRATNLDTYFTEVIDAVEAEGDDVRWRLPSKPIDAILSNQAGASNRTVTLSDSTTEKRITIASGRLRAGLNLIDNEGYPDFDAATDIEMVSAELLGPAIERISWAVDKTATDVLSGIHFDGTYVVAGSRQRVARMPMEMVLERPVTVAPGMLGALLRQRGQVQVGIDGTMLVIEPDDFSRIVCNTYGMPYPDVSKVCREDFEHKIEVKRDHLVASINSTLAVVGADRNPKLSLFFGKGAIAVFMENDEVGKARDIIDVPNFAQHDRAEVCFAPQYLLDALNHAPSDKVSLLYNLTNIERSPVCVDGGGGYMVWLAPRAKHGGV
jgi:DNA polymerase III sliding clamp (beta) subunit (PCNA family)